MVSPEWHYTVENSILSFFYMKGIRSLLAEKEFHTFHEILYMYNIDATLITEKDNIQVKSGDLVIIPKETFHQFVLRDPDSYWRSCFHLTGIESVPELSNLADSCADEVRILNAPQLSALLDSIPAALDDFYTDGEKSLYIEALFMQMLLEVKRNLKFSTSLKSRDHGSLVYRTLNYINENYRKHVDLDSIAVSLSVSSSTLSHQFKKELNISVHKYILRKRMIYAHRLLRMGLSSAEACEQSGYSDYAAFYRAYKNFYGISPTETKVKETS